MILSLRDRSFSHSPVSNGPMPPIRGIMSPIEWDRVTPVTKDTIYTDAEIFFAPKDTGAIAWTIEPIAGREDAYEFLVKRAPEFREVWTHDRRLLEMIPNGRFVPFGGCWIAPVDRKIWPKTKGISTIASNKRGGIGYDMRHEAIKRFPQIDAYGIEYTPLAHKIDALRDYRFQLVIENVRADWWFTEKLIDCFMTGTVPIYWGCPSIGKFFDNRGIIPIEGIEDLHNLLNIMAGIEEDLYMKAAQFIADNFERAKRYCLTERYIAENILGVDK